MNTENFQKKNLMLKETFHYILAAKGEMKLLSAWTKKADPDQTALVGAVCFGYTLFKVYFFQMEVFYRKVKPVLKTSNIKQKTCLKKSIISFPSFPV